MADNIHQGHRERIRKQTYENGFLGYGDHQVLEVILTYVIPYKDTNPIAHDLINTFGSLAGVLDAKIDDLIKVKGVGLKTATFLATLPKIFQAYNMSKAREKVVLDSPTKIVKYFKQYVTVCGNEDFYVACLDNRNNLIVLEKIGKGDAHAIRINMREFTSTILKHPTSAIVICHTHTTNDPQPSREDIMFTQRVIDITSPLGVAMVDHIIIAPDSHYSFFNAGRLGNAPVEGNPNFTDFKYSHE